MLRFQRKVYLCVINGLLAGCVSIEVTPNVLDLLLELSLSPFGGALRWVFVFRV